MENNNKMDKKLKIYKCDFCGKTIKGKKYQVVNENYIVQRGIF